MKSITSFLHNLLFSLRREREAPFLFEPCTLGFAAYCELIYYEVTSHRRRDMYLIEIFIQELVDIGILRSNPVQYYYYEFDTVTVHDVYLTTSDNATFSHGTALDISEAYAKAFGEVFERTSVRYNDDTRTVMATERSLEDKNVNHVALASFLEATQKQKELYPRAQYDKDTLFSWTPIVDLVTHNEVLIPAQSVFLSNFRSYFDEADIIESSSHGAGAGYTKEQAISSGILEITNRHFFLSSWYKHEIPLRIDLSTVPEDGELKVLINNFVARGFEIDFLNYSKEAGVPSVMCILKRFGGWSCGGTASLTLEGAMKRALMEAFSCYLWYVQRSCGGVNHFTHTDISLVRDGFIDDIYGDAFGRTMLYQYGMFVQSKPLSRSMITGQLIPFSREHDKQQGYDIVLHAKNLFKHVYVYCPKKDYVDRYKYVTAKVVIPGTYYFSLNETGSRPVKEGTYPQNTEMNPFP